MGNVDVENAGGGAALDAVAEDIVPDTDSAYDIGTTALRYKELFIDAITCTDTFEFQYIGIDAFRLTATATTPSGITSRGAIVGLFDATELALFTANAAGSLDSSALYIETGNTVNGDAGDIALTPGVASGSGANGVISIDGAVEAATNNALDFGTSSSGFRFMYARQTTLGGASTGNGTVQINDAGGAVFNMAANITFAKATATPLHGVLGHLNGTGDSLGIQTAANESNGATGNLYLDTGVTNATASDSGTIFLRSGDNSSSGDSGGITLAVGASTSGTRGDISLDATNIQLNDVPLIDAIVENGATASRPGAVLGKMFFDTDLGIPIWYDGTNWIDATGATV